MQIFKGEAGDLLYLSSTIGPYQPGTDLAPLLRQMVGALHCSLYLSQADETGAEHLKIASAVETESLTPRSCPRSYAKSPSSPIASKPRCGAETSTSVDQRTQAGHSRSRQSMLACTSASHPSHAGISGHAHEDPESERKQSAQFPGSAQEGPPHPR
jgi:hypothetical protein